MLILAHLLILSSCPRDVPFSEVYIRDSSKPNLLRTSVNPSAQQSSLKKLFLPWKSEPPHTLPEDGYILQRISTESCADLARQQGLYCTDSDCTKKLWQKYGPRGCLWPGCCTPEREEKARLLPTFPSVISWFLLLGLCPSGKRFSGQKRNKAWSSSHFSSKLGKRVLFKYL